MNNSFDKIIFNLIPKPAFAFLCRPVETRFTPSLIFPRRPKWCPACAPGGARALARGRSGLWKKRSRNAIPYSGIQINMIRWILFRILIFIRLENRFRSIWSKQNMIKKNGTYGQSNIKQGTPKRAEWEPLDCLKAKPWGKSARCCRCQKRGQQPKQVFCFDFSRQNLAEYSWRL